MDVLPTSTALFNKHLSGGGLNHYFSTIRTTAKHHTMAYDLVCLGNPLLDLQVDVEKAYLDKYDLKENDAILAEPKHMPIFDEVLKMNDVKLVAGGAAQNTARGAQYVLPTDSVLYFGSVGKDVYADKLVEANKSVGLTTAYMVQDDVATGKCAALINGVNRSLVTDLAAANHFKPSHLEIPENWAHVEGAKAFYIGGFHLTVSPEAIQKLGEHAAKTNKDFIMNFSAPFIAQFFKDPLDKCLPYADYVICNESEAAAYAESHELGTTDLNEIAKIVAKSPKVNTKKPRTVIFTQGTDATLTVAYDAAADNFEVKTFPVHVLDASKIADTNGAGDAFAAGFTAGLVQGKSLDTSVDMGHWLAKLSIQEIGPSYPFPKQTYSA
jgi:adenosine kinase